TFEWANGGQSNPGDNVAIGGTGWTPFGPTSANGVASTSVNSFTGGKIWVREQIQDGYNPFTGANGSNVSAEMYCHTDVNKYDNYDFINNPQAGLIYNCVAWNVPTPPPPPGNGCIQVLKETFNQDGNKITPVAQFTFTLDGGPTVHNDANGNAIFNNVTPGTHQVVEASAGPTWNLLSVTPASGNVNVQSGPICSAVVFKNKQVITTNPNPPTCVLSANPNSLSAPGTSTLSWSTTNATSATIDHGINGVPVPTGSTTTPTITGNTTFTMTVIGPGGQATCSAPVTVTIPAGPVCALSISASTITSGQSAVLSWTSS